jgi:hypothetical protein
VGPGLAALALLAVTRGLLLPAGDGATRRPGSPGWNAALLGSLVLYLLFVGNGFLLSSGDNRPARHLPSLILQHRTLDLSVLPEFADRTQRHYSVHWLGARTLSALPLGTPLLAVPYNALGLTASGGRVTPQLLARWEKHAAALLTVTATLLLFLALQQRAGTGPAAATAAVFALATPVATHNAQALWSTTGEALCVNLALYLLLARSRTGSAPALAGVAMGVAWLCRPTAVIALSVLGGLVLLRDRRAALRLGLAAAATIAAGAFLHYSWYGTILGGHGLSNAYGEFYDFDANAWLGGLLSPSRGILVFLPYLALLPLAARACREDRELRAWWWAALAITAATFALSVTFTKWWGGWCIGPRLITEAAPFLALLVLPLFSSFHQLHAGFRVVLVALVGFAAITQLLGAYRPAASQWNAVVDVDFHPDVLWSWRNGQLAAIWWPGWNFRPATETLHLTNDPEVDEDRWARTDLASVANARYDLDPFRPAVARPGWPRFGRIDPGVLNQPGAPFHFGPRGQANAVSVPAGGSAWIPAPGVTAVRAHVLLSVRTDVDGDARPVGRLRVLHADGSEERFPLRLFEEVHPYEAAPRPRAIPAGQLYFGEPRDRDALARTVLPLASASYVEAIVLESVSEAADDSLVLLALTFERLEPLKNHGSHQAGGRP